jgi:hypothetical protein
MFVTANRGIFEGLLLPQPTPTMAKKWVTVCVNILWLSQIFAPIIIVNDCGTKNPYQSSLSL